MSAIESNPLANLTAEAWCCFVAALPPDERGPIANAEAELRAIQCNTPLDILAEMAAVVERARYAFEAIERGAATGLRMITATSSAN